MADRPKILVVEDSPTTRQQITDLLEHEGYDVISAGDGEQALALVKEHHPELVVLDIVLPKKNGYQVCRNIKADPDLAIQVLMVTAKDQEKDRVWGHRQGADFYLSKPIDPAQLIGAVKQLVQCDADSSPLLETN